jgi:hypothetical protein
LAANPVAEAAIPAVLALAACPAMCAAMGGAKYGSADIFQKGRTKPKYSSLLLILNRMQQNSKQKV